MIRMINQEINEELSLENIAYRRLKEVHSPLTPNAIVTFPIVYSRICSTMCLKKKDALSVLYRMQSKGMIEIIPFHGVRVKIII